jgi:hypothetical protein
MNFSRPRPRRKVTAPSPSIIQTTASSISASNPPTPDLTSPSPAPSDQSETHSTHIEHQLPTTPTASKIVIEPEESEETPAPSLEASTSTPTPTATDSSSTIRKSFYSPLATFLRARYPSVRAPRGPTPPPITVKVEAEMAKDPSVSHSETECQPSETEEFGQMEADETATIKGSFRSIFGRSTKKDADISIST